MLFKRKAEVVPNKHEAALARLGTPEERIGDWVEAYGLDAMRYYLSAEANGGVPALILDPSDNLDLLWSVPFPADYLTTKEGEESFKRAAESIIAWTTKLGEQDRARALAKTAFAWD